MSPPGNRVDHDLVVHQRQLGVMAGQVVQGCLHRAVPILKAKLTLQKWMVRFPPLLSEGPGAVAVVLPPVVAGGERFC